MRNVDFSPLYRNAIGFDRLFNLMEASSAKNSSGGYPPYNIEQKTSITTVLQWRLQDLLKNSSI